MIEHFFPVRPQHHHFGLTALRRTFRSTKRITILLSIILSSEQLASAAITAVWANDGGDKVTQDELRVTRHMENRTGLTRNRVWDGSTIRLFGAHNEIVSFNLVLEAGSESPAFSVSVQFDSLVGPGGVSIHSRSATSNDVFDWTQRPIELFYARYLQVNGLSHFGYNKWDERQVPVRFQRPHLDNGNAFGGWYDRPDHDKFYPDPLVPIELVKKFDISAGQNQSVWADVYIPKDVPGGMYSGLVNISEDGQITKQIPVQLSVYGFVLPDQPSARTMAILSSGEIRSRYVSAGQYINWNTPGGRRAVAITDKYFQLFHRHKIALLGENECPIADRPCDTSIPRLDGSLYTPEHGYAGPGIGTAPGIFSIGTYGVWSWRDQDRSAMWQHTNAWATWFHSYLPGTEYFLYLQDEPKEPDWPKNETWAEWMSENPGLGNTVPSVITISPVIARAAIPHLSIAMTGTGNSCEPGQLFCDLSAITQDAADFYQSTPGRQLWAYNDGRPGAGSSMTEDDGIAMRTLPWVQNKMGFRRWMYWYVNPDGTSNLFRNAVTFGTVSHRDYSIGATGGDGTSNGNGLLVYPGTDLFNPADSYGVDGPFASLRLKEWRRGIQDVDYLAIAETIDPAAAKRIKDRILPKVMWQYGGTDPNYYVGDGQSWSSDPDIWEGARAELASIISQKCISVSGTDQSPATCINDVGAPDNTASSSENLQPLTITSSIPGAGMAIFGVGCGTGYRPLPATVRIHPGSLCAITIAAPPGFQFTEWADGNALNPRFIVMSEEAQTLSAHFKLSKSEQVAMTFTTSVPNSNIVVGGLHCAASGTFDLPSTLALTPGTQCTVQALVPPGYRFRQWSNGSTLNPLELTVPDQGQTLNVTLEPPVPINPNSPSLTLRSDSAGTSFLIIGSGCSSGPVMPPATLKVDSGSLCLVLAFALDGTSFTGWSDGDASNPRVIYIENQPVFLEAMFH